MGISRIDHVNLRTAKLQDMTDWYVDVLGFELGFRPNFEFGGAWLYRDDQPLVHLVDVPTDPEKSDDLHLEHVAFSATGLEAFRANLLAKGAEFKEVKLDEIKLVLLNIWDPDGNHLHIDFKIDG